MNKRDLIQNDMCSYILKVLDTILFCSIRLGKTRIALKAIEPMDRVLVVYPDKAIKKSWLDELEKFTPASTDITFVTKASVHKYANTEWDMLIIDEPQLCQSNKQIAAIKTIKYRKRVGLTGTLNNKTIKKLKDELNWKIGLTYTIADAIKDGLVKDYRIYIHFIDLDNVKLYEYERFGKTTSGTEKEIYEWYSSQMQSAEKKANEAENENERFKYRLMYKKYMGLRTNFLYNAESLLSKAKSLVQERANEKMLIYTLRTDIADQLSTFRYHSKDRDELMLEEFKEAPSGHAAVVNAVRAGVTIKGLNRVLFHSYESNTEVLYQKLGRSLLYEFEGQLSNIDLCCLKDTQMEVWVDQACRALEQDKINYVFNDHVYNKTEWLLVSHPDKELFYYDGAVVYRGADEPGMFGGTIKQYHFLNEPTKSYSLSEKKLIKL